MENSQAANSLKNIDSFFEIKKNEFLVSLYKKDYSTAEKIYLQIYQHAGTIEDFSENEQKRLNQIQTIFKQFKPDLIQYGSLNLQKHHTDLSRLITKNVKKSIHNVRHISYEKWEQKLGVTDAQKKLLFKTAMTFQLTCGCSNFCRRCNEWALPGIRKHFSFSAVARILEAMANKKNDEISLFGASDPLDWEEDNKTILDVVKLLEKKPLKYSLLTKVPKGKSILLRQLTERQTNLSVSVTTKNKTRIQKIQDEINHPLSKQHDTDDLMIPAGLDEDFISVKPSITDGYGVEITPDGAFIIIPTFTSALHPFGHKKIRVTSDTCFFPLKKTGRHALLVDYFKPLSGYNLSQEICHLTRLTDVQIESVILDTGRDELTPPGMRSTKEYLSIFEEKARLQRKKMTLSVIRRLKKQFLSRSKFRDLPRSEQEIYLKKIHRHLNLCKAENCRQAQIHTLSFFLESVLDYSRKNPLRIKILQFLLKNEIEGSETNFAEIILKKENVLSFFDPNTDPFVLFRYLILSILRQPKEKSKPENIYLAITCFIKAHPSTYDPVADLFVPRI